MRRWWVLLANAMVALRVFATDDLPAEEGEQPGEIEPQLLIQGRAADGTPVLTGAAAIPASEAELLKLERDLARARRNAAGAEHLYKAGIISKVEAEDRGLKVIRLEARLAEVRLQEAERRADEATPRAGETEGTTTLAAATAAAARAVEERRRAELEAAFRNLQRQQKLLALGSGRKADVNRAEQKLAELSALPANTRAPLPGHPERSRGIPR